MTEALLGVQAAATCNIAIGTETVSGKAASAPTRYLVIGGDIKPVPKKPFTSKELAGQMFGALPWRGIETFEMGLPMLPVIEDASSPIRPSGLGDLFLYLFGADDTDQLGSSAAYEHTFTWENLIKTFTLWLHYTTNVNEKIRMCAIDSFDMEIKNTGELTLDFKAMGADLWDVLDTDYGSESQIDMATVKQLSGLASRLEFGQPGAAVRGAWENLKLSMKRNLDYGAPGKAGQHPAGSGSPQIVSSPNSNIDFSITLRDLDREEILRGREGVNTAPTATRQQDTAGLVKGRVSIFGPAIAAGINGEADYVNAGTAVVTFAGTYTGSDLLSGEMEYLKYTKKFATLGLVFSSPYSDAKLVVEARAGSNATFGTPTVVGHTVTIKPVTVTSAITSTAAEILAHCLAQPAILAIFPFITLAEDEAGTTVDSDGVAETGLDETAFHYRITTGAGWGEWSRIIKIVKTTAQAMDAGCGIDTLGITANFDDDDIGADGDRWYFCSHYRYMLRANLPNMAYKDAVKPNFTGGVKKADIELTHTSQTSTSAARPSMDLWESKAIAYA